MSNGFKRGDVVQLKSGRPQMTVADVKEINGKLRVWCEWFQDNKVQKDTFAAESLKPAQ